MNKAQLRKSFVTKRLSLDQTEILKKSQKISKLVLELPQVKNARKLAIYLPVKNEVETQRIIDELITNGNRVYLPKYFSPWKKYDFVKFSGWTNLEKGPFGILQPKSVEVASSLQIDVAIIPGIAFDKNGVRLGYGKGVFDQLLSGLPAFKIGLAYDFQIAKKLPGEKHDLRMDIIVTEKGVTRS